VTGASFLCLPNLSFLPFPSLPSLLFLPFLALDIPYPLTSPYNHRVFSAFFRHLTTANSMESNATSSTSSKLSPGKFNGENANLRCSTTFTDVPTNEQNTDDTSLARGYGIIISSRVELLLQ